ncbi:MAG: aminoglycoside phosphotransferase [Pseudonocardia sp.]|nr:aminoglycoside phosphotransferase [Pseudonocardia sp.]
MPTETPTETTRTPALVSRPVASSVDELLAGASHREPFLTSDSKSGSGFERVVVDGVPHVLKHVHPDRDWTMRFNHDVGCHPVQVWAAGLMDSYPERIDHATVAVAGGLGRNGWGGAILMRDVGADLTPPGDTPLDHPTHSRHLADIAGLSARMLGWRDTVGLVPLAARWGWFGPACLAAEAARGWPDLVPRIAEQGWRRFAERAPRPVRDVVDALRRDPGPLVAAVASTPMTFVHGDWKLGNVGTGRDGRTVLLDWTYPGEAPPCYELAWYLVLNSSRLPTSKEATIAEFRAALERHGVDTAPWYERQVAICLLGALVIFGWEKALGSDAELHWWCRRAVEGARWL